MRSAGPARSARSRPDQRRVVTLLIGAALLLPLLATAPAQATPRRPDPLADAAGEATALRLQVDALRLQAARAIEAYDGASAAHGLSVTRHLSAQRELDAARQNAGAAGRAADRRVRALYVAGGAPALYALALQGGDLTDLDARLRAVHSILGTDRVQSRLADRAVTARTAAESALAAATARQSILQRAVAHRGEAVRALLGRTDVLLAAADARVVQLAEEQRRAAEAAAAAAARVILAQATGQDLGSGTPLGPVAAPTEAAGIAIARAATHLGKPYLWGGNGPDRFDCSGLTVDAYRAAGIALPRTAAQQWFAGPPVALADLAPGDLLYWADDLADAQTIHHVAISLGGSRMLAAPHTGAFVRIQPVYFQGYLGATRPSAR